MPTAGFACLDGVKVIEKADNSVTLEFSVPGASPYFDGHFPGFPILPAVAQVELVIRFASEHLGTGIDVSEIRRIKLTKPVWPNIPLLLSIERGKKTLSFRICSPGGETVYSSGTMLIRESL